MSTSYNFRKEASVVQPSVLFKAMKDAVESLLEARVKVRSVHEKLSDVANDATGVYFTGVYDDRNVVMVRDEAYELDRQIGAVFNAIERLERDLKQKVVKSGTPF